MDIDHVGVALVFLAVKDHVWVGKTIATTTALKARSVYFPS